MSQGNLICSICGTVRDPVRVTKGSFLIEVVLWIFFIIPGVIYSIWRLTSRYDACPECKNASMIPITSPAGQKLFLEQTQPGIPKQTTLEIKPHLKKEITQVRNLATNYINKMISKKP